MSCDICPAKRYVGQGRTQLIESVTGFKAELSNPHRGDWEQIATGFEKGDQPGQLCLRIGASDDFKDGCAGRRGGARMAEEFVKGERGAQIVEGNQKFDLAPLAFRRSHPAFGQPIGVRDR